MAIAGQLEVQIVADVATLRTDMEKARAHLDRFSSNATRAIGLVTKAFGVLGGVGAAGWAADFVRSSIEAQASLQDLHERTGVAVETLSGLHQVAKLSGTGMDQVAAATQRLSKNMAEAAGGSESAGEVFKALGIEVKNADGTLRDTGAVLVDIAKKLANAKDQTAAVAYAQQLLGKSGANLLPLMKDLAEQGELVALTTGEQAKAADDLQKQWAKLLQQTDIAKNDLATGLVPVLTDVINALNKLNASFGGATEAAWAFAKAPIPTLWKAAFGDAAKEVENLQEKIQTLQSRLGNNRGRNDAAINSQIDALKIELQSAEAVVKRLEKLNATPPAQTPTDLPQVVDDGARKKAGDALLKEQERVQKLFVDGWVSAIEVQIKEYEDYLAVLAQMQDQAAKKELDAWKDDFKAMQDMMEEGRRAMKEASEKAEQEQRDHAEAVREYAQEFGAAFEDAIADGEKLSDVMRTLAKDIAALAIRKNLTEPLMEAMEAILSGGGSGGGGSGLGGLLGSFAGMFGGGGGGGGYMAGEYINAYADGGRPPLGRPSLVGEEGPELFVPDVSGTIVPNGSFGGSSVVIHQVNHIDSRSDRAQIENMIARANARSEAKILDNMNRGLEFGRAAGKN